MKKSLLIVPLALALFSCANDKELATPSQGGNDDATDLSYLTVNISSVGDVATRDSQEDDLDHPFADGIADEYSISSIGFYFFDENLNTVNVINGNTYYKKVDNPTTETTTETPNVTIETKAKIVLTTGGNSTPAKYILAIVNPTTALDNASITKYDDLKGISEATLYGTGKKDFIMSNSVYKNTNVEDLVDISGYLQQTISDAEDTPVTIYVERQAAKASMSVSTEEGNLEESSTTGKNIYKLPEVPAVGGEDYVELGDVYVKFLGWDVVATPNTSYAIKHINSEWASNPWATWNGGTTYHRSYWAINSTAITSYSYDSYDNLTGENGLTSFNYTETSPNAKSYTYMHENAFVPTKASPEVEGYDAEHFPVSNSTATTSKIIVCAQLCDATGENPIEFADYAGGRYPLTSSTATTLLQAMANYSGVYARTGSNTPEDPYVFTQISAEDYLKYLELIEYESLDAKQKAAVATLNEGALVGENYMTYAQFKNSETFPTATEPGADNLVFTDGSAATSTVLDKDGFNEMVIKYAGPAKVWKGGKTYYYTEIQHLNPTKYAEGYFGVVRNHWYSTTITGVTGFGTPVFNPDKVIYPQTPEDDPWSYLAAKIKVLAWHRVNNDVVLGQEY